MKVYISEHCFLCRWIEPGVRWLGIELWKVHGTIAKRVNGAETEPYAFGAVPAFVRGQVAVVGLPRTLANLIGRP